MQIAWFQNFVPPTIPLAALRWPKRWSAWALFATATALTGPNASAQGASQLAGAWEGATLAAPIDFYESYYNHETKTTRSGMGSPDFNRANETLVDIHFYDDFESIQEVITVSDNGAFTGTGSGKITVPGVGLVEALTPERVYGHFSVSNDLMMFLTSEPRGSQDLTFLLRKPASTALRDLAGRWNASSYSMPKVVHRVYYNHVTQRARHSSSRSDSIRTNETLADIYLPSPWEVENTPLNVNSAGVIAEIPEARLEVGTDGTVWFREEELLDRLRINASKDVMIMTPNDPGQAEMIVFVKAPQAIAPADLAGVWRLNAFHSPTDIRKTYYNPETRQGRQTSINDSARQGEIFSDAWQSRHVVERGNIRIGQNGAVSGLVSGTMSTGAGGAVTFTSEDGSVGGFINASKTLIVICETRPHESEQTIALLVKLSHNPDLSPEALVVQPKVELTTEGHLKIEVVPDDQQIMQRSSNLANGGSWTTIEDSAGAGRVTLATDAAAGFVRVVRPAP